MFRYRLSSPAVAPQWWDTFPAPSSWRKIVVAGSTLLCSGTLWVQSTAHSQDVVCTPTTTYRLVPQTVYEERPVVVNRLEYDTVVEHRPVTVYRQVWETEMRQRTYRVARPVVENSTREEQYTVLKPVYNTQYREETVEKVEWVTETSTREETRTVMKPVVETQVRQEQQIVRRPVTETVYQDQVTMAWKPVTTVANQLVDQGMYMDKVTVTEREPRNRLRWVPRTETVNPLTGLPTSQRAGLYWVPEQVARGTYSVDRVYVPNYVNQPIAQTALVPEQVVQKVAVPVTSYRDEVVSREVPVQVTHMVPEEQVRYVPVTVQRPVVRQEVRRVPVQSVEWQRQVMTRQVPVQTYRTVYEDRVESYPVQVLKTVAEAKTLEVKKSVPKWVPYQTTQRVAKQVVLRVPLDTVVSAGSVTSVVSPAAGTTETYRIVPDDELKQRANNAASTEAQRPAGEANSRTESPVDQTMPKGPELNPAETTRPRLAPEAANPLGQLPALPRRQL